jgi:hypothetical protein
LQSSDGKFYKTDVSDTETIFRLIQPVPSPKAEPFKLWLAKVGYERIEEINDPEKALNRSVILSEIKKIYLNFLMKSKDPSYWQIIFKTHHCLNCCL